MFIINITYKVALDRVDSFLAEHVSYLNSQYDQRNFIASGRKVPRTGGIIISPLTDKDQITSIINEDPFKVHDLADYELIEFIPGKASDELRFLLDG